MDSTSIQVFSASIPILKRVWLTIKLFFPRVQNLISRPKLSVEFKAGRFNFLTPENKQHLILIPHVAITNLKPKKIRIRADQIYFNNTNYMNMWNGEILRALDKAQAKACNINNIEIMHSYYQANWTEITEKRASITIEEEETKIFPIMPLGDAITNLTSKKKYSKLFFANKKITITININGKDYEYGFNRIKFYEDYFNYFASYTARYPSPKDF